MADIYIYGKVKRKNNLFRILASENEVYEQDKIPTDGVEYDPNTLIEPEEYYKISNFSVTDFSIDFIKDELNSVDFDQIVENDLKKLSYICTVQEQIYFFQAISTSYYIKKKWILISELSLKEDEPIITVNEYADVIYDKVSDTLYFKKLSVANRVFKGLDQLYREATAEESQMFLESDFLEVNADYDVSKVSIPNRKKIALIKDTLEKYDEIEKQAIYDYIRDYGQVVYNDGKFKIQNDNDLKYVLWGIEQRYYTTPIGGEKRVANSVITI